MAEPKTENRNRHPNDVGADLWVRPNQPRHHPTAGRGLFAGLQDVKHYDVNDGWARRKADKAEGGFLSFLWNRMSGGAYHYPEQHKDKDNQKREEHD